MPLNKETNQFLKELNFLEIIHAVDAAVRYLVYA